MSSNFWRSVDLKKLEIPEEILSRRKAVLVSDGFKKVDDINVFYREVPAAQEDPEGISLLLLHGMMFSSKTWLDLGTLHAVGAMGYRVVAVDLPGFGNSPKSNIRNRSQFLRDLLTVLGLKRAAIVSPSMSGFYTLPFLLEHWDTIVGFIPVAPVGIEVLEKEPPLQDLSVIESIYEPLQKFLTKTVPDLSHIMTPTMVVFGENDRSRSSALLSLLPQSQCQEIPKGGHPAYLQDPELWHKLLYNFMHHLSHQQLTT